MQSVEGKGMGLKIGMAVVGAAVIFVAVMSVVGGRIGGRGGGEVMLMCADPKCGQAFEVPAGKYASMDQGMDETAGSAVLGYPCPQCKQRTGFMARQCPSCAKPFLDTQARRSRAGGLICPHCNTDLGASKARPGR